MAVTFKSRGLSPLEGILSKCVAEGDCILFTGRKNSDGYGLCSIEQIPKRVHRLMYEAFVGPIPEGLTLDHLCRIRHCCNPAHLEPVTPVENVMRGIAPSAQNARKIRCPRGHAYDGQDRKQRTCSRCHAMHQRNYRARKAAASC